MDFSKTQFSRQSFLEIVALFRTVIVYIHSKNCIILPFSFSCFSRPVPDSILVRTIKSCHIFHCIMADLFEFVKFADACNAFRGMGTLKI